MYCLCIIVTSELYVDQVELLWRRAEGDAREVHSGRLYMLVSAEQLDYDISRRVEESLEKHSHAVPGQFNVAFAVVLVTHFGHAVCVKIFNSTGIMTS